MNKRDEFSQKLELFGWQKDRFGNYKRGEYRIKMQKISFRIERKGKSGWINVGYNQSLYYKDYAEITKKFKHIFFCKLNTCIFDVVIQCLDCTQYKEW